MGQTSYFWRNWW